MTIETRQLDNPPDCYRGRDYNPEATPGLGFLAYWDGLGEGKRRWFYKPPTRPWVPVDARYQYREKAPPLPRPQQTRPRCSCREGIHRCGACGQLAWVEMHGYADGYCTYCYWQG